MDLNDVEHIAFRALGGVDVITINDLSATDVTKIDIDLGASGGGGDLQADRVTLNGAAAGEIINAGFVGSGHVDITGAPAGLTLLNAEASDQLLINGGGGNDVINASAIPVGAITLTLDGGIGDDALTGGAGSEVLSGGTGFDTIFGGADNDLIGGGDQGDLLSGEEGNDLINGGMGLDTIDGGIGDDTINGGVGSDTVFGNAGFDQIHGNDGNDTINGADQGDLITGDAGDDVIGGGMGLDTIDGGIGNDTITGGMGNDQLTGGADADTFAFGLPGAANDGLDTITDFVSGTDTIQISAAGYGGGLAVNASVTLVTADSVVNANSGAGGYFIFDNSGPDTGTVYWDANGGNGADAVAVAVLTGVASLQAADFHVV
jgi:Ca2+-binding RTX toxin-like protein